MADLEPRARLAATCPGLCSLPPRSRQAGFVRAVCRMWLGDPSPQEAARCAHRFLQQPGAGGRKPSLCWGRCQVLGTQAAELGLFIGPEACRLRNAGSRLELAGSCLRQAQRSTMQPAARLPHPGAVWGLRAAGAVLPLWGHGDEAAVYKCRELSRGRSCLAVLGGTACAVWELGCTVGAGDASLQ